MSTLEFTETCRLESIYCTDPRNVPNPDVLIIGSAIGLFAATDLLAKDAHRILVVDAGPFDLPTHLGNTAIPRLQFILDGGKRVSGKLALWGVSTPRPQMQELKQWPYPMDSLLASFDAVEKQLAIADSIPYSDLIIERAVIERLREVIPNATVRRAPLAIDRFGHRWSPLDRVAELVRKGLNLTSRFKCTALHREGNAIVSVDGVWRDSKRVTLRPKIVVLAVGVEPSFELIQPICARTLPIEPSDHIRVDAHGSLPRDAFGSAPIEDLGIAAVIVELRCKEHSIPYHLEVKVGPRALWPRYMPSGDNLEGSEDPETIYVQIQAIAAMHARFPTRDLLRVRSSIPPVMSAQDAFFQGEIVQTMFDVASALNLTPTFAFRPLLANHHVYGAYRVGSAVSSEFKLDGFQNLFVLPPSAYVDSDDDANPTLKSCVLSLRATDEINRLMCRGVNPN